MPELWRCQRLISFSLNESTEEPRVGRFWQGRNRGVLEKFSIVDINQQLAHIDCPAIWIRDKLIKYS